MDAARPPQGTGSATITDQPAGRQLRRSADDRMLAGLASGILVWTKFRPRRSHQ